MSNSYARNYNKVPHMMKFHEISYKAHDNDGPERGISGNVFTRSLYVDCQPSMQLLTVAAVGITTY